MKQLPVFGCLLAIAASITARGQEVSKITVPNPSHKPPEATAEIFAPGAVSLPGRIEFCLALSPDENEAFFAVRQGPGQWEIRRTERRDGAWQPSVVAPFSGAHSDLEPTFSPDGKAGQPLKLFDPRSPQGLVGGLPSSPLTRSTS